MTLSQHKKDKDMDNQKEVDFCPICDKVLREDHICQGRENQDNQWK